MAALALDDLLVELRRRRWLLHFFGPDREHLNAIGATADWTLRAVLTLDPPDHPRAPRAIEVPAPCCAVPLEERRPMTIRPAR